MATPTLSSLSPAAGPTSGGDLVRIVGQCFGERVAVRFGASAADVLSVREEVGVSVADVRTPPHPEGSVPVTLVNLDPNGGPIPDERVTRIDAYRYVRRPLVAEANVTRLVRALLRRLDAQILPDPTMTVALDYFDVEDTPDDTLRVVPIASLPSLVLSGPTVRPSRRYATNVLFEEVVPGLTGPEVLRRRPPFTVDLAFTLTAASDRTAELLNLMASVASFLHRNRWLTLPRDPERPELGDARWEMDPEGDFRTRLRGSDGIHVFTCGLVVRGFDLDEGLPMDRGRAVARTELVTAAHGGAA